MTRLLERGPHTVTVTPAVASTDALGAVTRPGEPVTVSAVMVQPVSSAGSDQATGTVGPSTWRVIGAGRWPGGPYAQVRVDSGPPGTQGRVFDQVGEALQRGSGRRTPHFTVTIASAGREVS